MCFILRKGLLGLLVISHLMVGVAQAIDFLDATPEVTVKRSQLLPEGAEIVSGRASFSQSIDTLRVNQRSDTLVTEWDAFNIGQEATVIFNQPSAASIALNRVTSARPSRILGKLFSNGQVFLVNPYGILFGPESSIDVGGLVASTLSLSNESFLNRTGDFTNMGAAAGIENQGSIHAHLGGYLAFIAPKISNKGAISSPNGTVAMASGDRVLLDQTGDGLITLSVSKATVNALIENQQVIKSYGGAILMTTKAAGTLPTTTINNTGVLEAKSISRRDGKIILDAGNIGTAVVGGVLDASSTHGTGGSIVVTGREVTVTKKAVLNTNGQMGGGNVFVGGGWEGSGNIHQALLTTIESGAKIQADATSVGRGGMIVAWSNTEDASSATYVYGSLSAKGAGGKSGGKIETSGYILSLTDSTIDTTNDLGASGTWLIDPNHF